VLCQVQETGQDRTGVAPLKKLGQLFNSGKEKAQILVDQFQSVFTIDTSTELPDTPRRSKSKIPPLVITVKGTQKLLAGINTTKAQGPDMMSNTILKNCAEQLAPGLQRIFQCSIDSGKLPSDWLHAFITPVFKKGDRHQAVNYRPVSLTCVSCKILEHIICKHIMDHLEKNKILTSLNHGFRSGYSCETQLVTTIHDLMTHYDAGAQIDMAVLDFSKAFDTVPHDKLLHKMNMYGVDGSLNSWLKDFLTSRSMQVVVDGEKSESVHVASGVPQGTVLGPILFLCHINDLPDSVKSTVRLFADDCLLYRRIRNMADHARLQKDLAELEKWATTWGMRFNAKKCYIISINSKSQHFYQLDQHILQQVEETQYVGVKNSDSLKFGPHISKIAKKAKKANSTLGFLRKNLKHCPATCRMTAFLALVRSTLEYSSVVWDPHLTKDIDRLERVQRQAARFITRDYSTRSPGCVTEMLQQLELPPLQTRRRQNRLTFFFKVVEGLVPAMPCQDYLTPIRGKRNIKAKRFQDCVSSNIVERHEVNHTRGFKNFPCRSTIFANSFFPQTVIDWNHLPDSAVRAETLGAFKTALQQRA